MRLIIMISVSSVSEFYFAAAIAQRWVVVAARRDQPVP
jgi:hypothetical protein